VVSQNRNQRQRLKKTIVKKQSKAFLPLPIKRLMTSLQQLKPRIMWIKTGFKAPFAALWGSDTLKAMDYHHEKTGHLWPAFVVWVI
jgi:hypothetical protein